MAAEHAAPCRHAGVPPEDIIQRCVDLITTIAIDGPYLAKHGLSIDEYTRALPVAIERIRGSAAASNSDRRQFLSAILEALVDRNLISFLQMPRYGDDTVYRLTVPDFGDIAVIQKGCPDGAHSSIRWSVPEWAKETYLWWSCPSLSHAPGTHVVKGINRLKSRFFPKNADDTGSDLIDGVIFHNELCGTSQRPCPKLSRSVRLNGLSIPPPCIYVLPERDIGSADWNWEGQRQLVFPKILLGLFDIRSDEVIAFTGHVGFQSKGDKVKTKISLRFGPGRSTIFRG